MIIKELTLNNIRSHKNTKIEFNKGITVISGRTGCGKSSLFMSIAYALFGSTISLGNNSLLRRRAKEGWVKLKFTNGNDEYEIMRGMKRTGNKILVNADKLWIKKNNNLLPIISRTKEVNEKILEILNYPTDIKPKELFEITCYAKQDEIRKLIELTSGEREKYIDRVLQLSKYELTYENMKQLINKLNNELSLKKGQAENIEFINNQLINKKQEEESIIKSIKEVNELLKNNEEKLIIIKKDYEIINKKRKELELIKEKYDSKKGLLNGFQNELIKIKNELKNTEKPTECKLDQLIKEQSKAIGEERNTNIKINDLRKELINFEKLKSGKCPLCKQEVSNEHINSVKELIKKQLNELIKKEKELKKIIEELSERIRKERVIKELINNLKNKEERLKELETKISEIKKEIIILEPSINELKNIKEEFNQKNNLFIEKEKEHSTLKEKKNNLETRSKQLITEINNLTTELNELNKSKEELIIIERKTKFIKRLREDIRSIRGAVRTRFLEDFRHEFQKKYEELRPDGYSVDINNDYAPIAYAENEETSINALSGGEKTSVALSYRLALSEIAARVSSIKHNELLMLDEPTTGFDRIDINSLPETLRNIKQIPQIIIVSHEDELKEAADIKYELIKKNNETIINQT